MTKRPKEPRFLVHYWRDKNNTRHVTVSIPIPWWKPFMFNRELASAAGWTWEEAKTQALAEARMVLDDPIPPDEAIIL